MNVISKAGLSKDLISWWQTHHREFPWRRNRTPYKILIAEILLHRTQASQVAPVFATFLQNYPDLRRLSSASAADLHQLLDPLGLRWRTDLLLKMVKILSAKYGGKIPSDRIELESLPGVGHYIAAAVRCFAFGLPEPILDTNTVRVVGRLFGVKITDGSRRSKKFKDLYEQIMERERPPEFNFAMLDLASLICKPAKPLCHVCPLMNMCEFGKAALASADKQK